MKLAYFLFLTCLLSSFYLLLPASLGLEWAWGGREHRKVREGLAWSASSWHGLASVIQMDLEVARSVKACSWSSQRPAPSPKHPSPRPLHVVGGIPVSPCWFTYSVTLTISPTSFWCNAFTLPGSSVPQILGLMANTGHLQCALSPACTLYYYMIAMPVLQVQKLSLRNLREGVQISELECGGAMIWAHTVLLRVLLWTAISYFVLMLLSFGSSSWATEKL